MSAQKVWIGTGWKMNKTLAEARAYTRQLGREAIPDSVQAFILPPHTALASVREALPAASPILIGAQNAHWAAEGAYTGEISMRMVADAGAVLVEMGHSERREAFGETDETVGLKARAALDAGLTPLVCVGEPAQVRDAGAAQEFVVGQIRAALARLSPDEIARVVVAYEPVWAIGEGGRPATAAETSPIMAGLAEELDTASDGTGCRALLYGGSVDQENAAGLIRAPHTDGLFVGRSAWTATGLLELIRIGGDFAKERESL